MGDLSFGQTVGMLKNAIDGAGTAHAVIANNIANVNTPAFRRSDVSFKDALATAEAAPADPDAFDLATSSERHLTPSGQPPEPFSITTTVDTGTAMRVDGSNVDVDQEMAKLSLNSAYAQTMGQLLQNQYARLRQAIQERF